MHRRPSILSYRPKTSSAADDDNTQEREHTMKRTASQTFSGNPYDGRDGGVMLDAVREGPMCLDNSTEHSHSSFTRALGSLRQFTPQKARRRLSSFSSASSAPPRRRGSIQSLLDSLPTPSRKPSIDNQRVPLQHQDSGLPTLHTQPQPSTRPFQWARFGSMRRRQAASCPSGDAQSFASSAWPPLPLPGAAARQAAAAANQDRQRREQEQHQETQRFLSGHIPSFSRDDDLKDNESGVDMTCASDIVRADSVTEKKMIDPFERLPAELATSVLSNLDAASLISAERVSHGWRKLANSSHVWRNVFLRKYEPEVHVSPAPIQMGGTGIGKVVNGHPAPGQDWKDMYAARAGINKKWLAGTPAAIYLNGHTDSVYCCQFDETKAITGSRDRTIRVWDLKTYKCVKVYGGPNHRPTHGTPQPMEERPERVISNPSMNGTAAGHNIYVVPADYHDASILCLQYDNEIMVTGSSDYTCIVWDITGDTYVPMHRLRGHEAGVLDVCLDDKYIISCSKDAMIKVWDRKTGTCIRTLKGHRGPVNAVQLRGNFLVSASGDGVAKLWNLETGLSIKDFPSEDRGLAAVEFSDDAKYVLAGGNDHVVYKFDAQTGNLVHSRVKHEGLVRSLFLDAFNGRIVSGSYDQSIQVSDYETGVPFATYKNWTTSWILSAKSDYRRVVATSQDGRTLILDFGYNIKGAEKLVGNTQFVPSEK
ncbi:WD40 repeat-like protein [Setomelanomma holmii]|uniref:WD40 repeat-like protein n=1 Tax=Setomelanomma holmii TaxID=210430 RepID=A0A9P4LIB3_9PLEO|nr:WD40 repeat-like protein [Setomelanomma holmii]